MHIARFPGPRARAAGTKPAFRGSDVRHGVGVSALVQQRPHPPAHSDLWGIRAIGPVKEEQ
jgi:hypothetical protein